MTRVDAGRGNHFRRDTGCIKRLSGTSRCATKNNHVLLVDGIALDAVVVVETNGSGLEHEDALLSQQRVSTRLVQGDLNTQQNTCHRAHMATVWRSLYIRVTAYTYLNTKISRSNTVPATLGFSSPPWILERSSGFHTEVQDSRVHRSSASYKKSACLTRLARFQPRCCRRHPHGRVAMHHCCQPPTPTEHFWCLHAV